MLHIPNTFQFLFHHCNLNIECITILIRNFGAKGEISDGFWPPTRAFSKPPPPHPPPPPPHTHTPTIFRKHMPSGIGTEGLRMIGCIFAENGPLEGGIESSFSGTGWGAKGDFMRYSYLYPYIFETRTHNLFESTCPELYAQQSWEWPLESEL